MWRVVSCGTLIDIESRRDGIPFAGLTEE